ncbi:hypothetical protein COOONC_24263 [Cooperia oncophora]
MQHSASQAAEGGGSSNGNDERSSTPDRTNEMKENGKHGKNESAGKRSGTHSEAKKKKKRAAPQDSHEKRNGDVSSAKRHRKVKRTITADNELGYTNGCVVDAYKGFSAKYDEPVILVSYKEPLPSGFESRQDEIVPIRLVAKTDPQVKISQYLVTKYT